jgi:hypothetical protein
MKNPFKNEKVYKSSSASKPMEELSILKELFDEKVVKIINLFFEHPDKQFYLSEVSNLSKVNIATTFRILNKLVIREFLKTNTIGKIKLYYLNRNEKTLALSRMLTRGKDPVTEFIEKIKISPGLGKIVLESRGRSSAKVLLVGDVSEERAARICEEIRNKYKFAIEFIVISEKQFHGFKNFQDYRLERKLVWERKDTGN